MSATPAVVASLVAGELEARIVRLRGEVERTRECLARERDTNDKLRGTISTLNGVLFQCVQSLEYVAAEAPNFHNGSATRAALVQEGTDLLVATEKIARGR